MRGRRRVSGWHSSAAMAAVLGLVGCLDPSPDPWPHREDPATEASNGVADSSGGIDSNGPPPGATPVSSASTPNAPSDDAASFEEGLAGPDAGAPPAVADAGRAPEAGAPQ